MQNPLDGLCVYDIAEHREAREIVRNVERITESMPVRLFVKHRGNMQRLLRAGFQVYRPKKDGESYLLAMPEYMPTNIDNFTPVLLIDNKVVGM